MAVIEMLCSLASFSILVARLAAVTFTVALPLVVTVALALALLAALDFLLGFKAVKLSDFLSSLTMALGCDKPSSGLLSAMVSRSLAFAAIAIVSLCTCHRYDQTQLPWYMIAFQRGSSCQLMFELLLF